MLFSKRKKTQSSKKVLSNSKQTANEFIQLAELNIRVIRSQRKSISLHIKPEGIVLRAPLYSQRVALKAFALSKVEWLRKHHSNIQSQQVYREYSDGETWLLFGQDITLRIDKGVASRIDFNSETYELTVTIGSRVKNSEPFIKQYLHNWYKATAQDYLAVQVPQLADKMGLDYQSINVRDYKARWGSCSSNGKLSFNWRIFMAPEAVIDSVIMHELAHTKHFNHSQKFWELVYFHCPEYKIHHTWLKKNQFMLQA